MAFMLASLHAALHAAVARVAKVKLSKAELQAHSSLKPGLASCGWQGC
jgi:hypothetical protein